jgi:glycosyltransferase involved in cell wall biosynthesis
MQDREAAHRQAMMSVLRSLANGMRRLVLEVEDTLRYHPLIRGFLCRSKLWRDRMQPANDASAATRSILNLCAAARLATSDAAQAGIQQRIVARASHLDADWLDWPALAPGVDSGRIAKGVILKRYHGPQERGVVFISFEYEWARVLRIRDRDEFARHYTVVLSPSSSPHNLVNYIFPAVFPAPVFTLISNPGDVMVLPRVSPNLIVVPLYASHWVNPDLYQPMPRDQRPFDLIMVAAFGKVKRHHVLFKALRRMPRDLRVLLIGQDQDGRTGETMRQLASWYSVADRFTLRENQSYQAVTAAFCQARTSVVLSRREGSCVVIAESLMADTPAALLEGAEIGSRVFLNDQTGRLLREADLTRELTAFVREGDRYQPRRWAVEHISCFRSSVALNEVLREHALSRGEVWSQDIAPLQWAPDPQLVRAEDRASLAGEREAIRERFGLDIGRGVEGVAAR